MEFFQRAKVFRLKCSGQSKYLVANKDEETVSQSRNSSSKKAHWAYETVEGKPNVIRLRSCSSWRYLAVTEDPFLLGMTGKKVAQTISQGPTIEWEPIKEGLHIKLKSHTGSMLRANRGPPPWRNSVTHNEPNHWTATESMTLWIVDIVEIDYHSSRKGNGDSNTSTEEVKGTTDASLSCNVAEQQVFSSSPTYFSPQGSFDENRHAAEHSDSFIKLKSMLSSLDEEINVTKANETKFGRVSENSVQNTSERVQSLQVKKAKQTFENLKMESFHTILSMGQQKQLEEAVSVLIADAKYTGRSKITSKLISIQEQLKGMKNEHERASQDLVKYSTFATRRLEIREELKRHATQARGLETFEVDINNTIADARAKREELLKQLEETEYAIKEVEKTQADNVAEVEELISRIEKKSEKLMEMESKEKSWQVRKNEAERMLRRVEQDWQKAKKVFPEI